MESSAKRDLYQEVTGKIIASLEKGVVPWHQPWGYIEPPQNHFTGHKYRGVNLLLFLIGEYQTPYFGTIKQINAAGGKVKKGAKSVPVYFHDTLYKDRKTGRRIPPDEAKTLIKAGQKEKISAFSFMRLFPVFNMSDVEGCPVKPLTAKGNTDNQEIAVCRDFLAELTSPPALEHGHGSAYYLPKKDIVCMPDLLSFEGSQEYYSTLFHELVHATGHESRLNRKTLQDALKFGDTNYSREELTAEIGCAFLCNHLGIATPKVHENQAAYIQNWLTRLRKDKTFVWDASTDAQAAFSFLVNAY